MEPLLESINRGTENSKWLAAHYAELAQRYEGEWVAVYERQVVGHGKNLSRLARPLKRKYGKAHDEIAFEYVTRKPIELIL